MTRSDFYGCLSNRQNNAHGLGSLRSIKKYLFIIPLAVGLFYPHTVCNPHTNLADEPKLYFYQDSVKDNFDRYFLTKNLKSKVDIAVKNLVNSKDSKNELGKVLSELSAYDNFILEASKFKDLDVNFIKAYSAQESSGNPNAESPRGAKGLGGLIKDTAKEVGLVVNHLVDERVDPKATLGSAAYMKSCIDRFNIILGLVAYNRGPSWVSKNLDNILKKPDILNNDAIPLESRRYIVEVLARFEIFSNPQGYGLQFESKKPISREFHKQHLTKNGVSLKNLANLYKVRLADLKKANPAIKSDSVPKGINVYIPSNS